MKIRTACFESDAPAIASICTLGEPDQPVSTEMVRTWFERDAAGRTSLRLVAQDDNGDVSGYCAAVHDTWIPDGHFFYWMGVFPSHQGKGCGTALWKAAQVFMQEHGVTRIMSEVLDNAPAGLAYAQKIGFTIDRQIFDSSLDLTTFDEAPFLEGIKRVGNEGIRFCSLADFPDTPENHQKFYELNFAVVQDIPGEDWEFAEYHKFFEERIWGSPRFRRENHILALDGDTWVGFASVALFPEDHRAYNNTTGVIRAYRGRKIAVALKVLAARYVRSRGALTITTDNDSTNAPILAVNQKMGYIPRPGKYMLVRTEGAGTA
ncbi:MAG TPA: GNAT family N-acetyltransferase [Longilinea sp.]|nr:GNAT family N-acetyltransferase [Longilinea sp.]